MYQYRADFTGLAGSENLLMKKSIFLLILDELILNLVFDWNEKSDIMKEMMELGRKHRINCLFRWSEVCEKFLKLFQFQPRWPETIWSNISSLGAGL